MFIRKNKCSAAVALDCKSPSPPPEVAGTDARIARQGWIDAAKVIGIILVVIGHSINGVINARISGDLSYLASINDFIYTFHVPMFFFISGLFVVRRLREDSAKLRRSLLTKIAWPYILWASIQSIVGALAGDLVNVPYLYKFGDIVELLWLPPAQFWFLWALIGMHIICLLSMRNGGYPVLVASSVSLLTLSQVVDLAYVQRLALQLNIFYVAGVLWGGSKDVSALRTFQSNIRLNSVAITFIFTLWLMLAWAVLSRGISPTSLAALPAAIFGIIGTLMLSSSKKLSANMILKIIGKSSVTILVLHVFFSAGSRIVCSKIFNFNDANVIVLIASVIGIVGPLAMLWMTRKLRIAHALGLS